MKKAKPIMALAAAAGAAALAAFGATEVVNDLAPYDRTVVNAYWDTRSHPTREVSAEGRELAGGFDSACCSAASVVLVSFSSRQPGAILVVR